MVIWALLPKYNSVGNGLASALCTQHCPLNVTGNAPYLCLDLTSVIHLNSRIIIPLRRDQIPSSSPRKELPGADGLGLQALAHPTLRKGGLVGLERARYRVTAGGGCDLCGPPPAPLQLHRQGLYNTSHGIDCSHSSHCGVLSSPGPGAPTALPPPEYGESLIKGVLRDWT